MLGLTAWRVIHPSSDSHYLEVCFSTPGTSQPQIAPDGAATDDTYGCVNSALISQLPIVEGEGKGETGTGSKGETGTGTGGGSSLKQVVVKINGKRVALVKGILRLQKSGVMLTKLPTGAYKLSVVATTVLNQHLSGSRT